MFSKNLINNASRPADAIVKLAFESQTHDRIGEERYYVLDNEFQVRDMVKLTGDHEFMEMYLRQTIMDVGVAEEQTLSPV